METLGRGERAWSRRRVHSASSHQPNSAVASGRYTLVPTAQMSASGFCNASPFSSVSCRASRRCGRARASQGCHVLQRAQQLASLRSPRSQLIAHTSATPGMVPARPPAAQSEARGRDACRSENACTKRSRARPVLYTRRLPVPAAVLRQNAVNARVAASATASRPTMVPSRSDTCGGS